MYCFYSLGQAFWSANWVKMDLEFLKTQKGCWQPASKTSLGSIFSLEFEAETWPYRPILDWLSQLLVTTWMFLFSECNCHEHADSCIFNELLYEASGQTSGGVCQVSYVFFIYL